MSINAQFATLYALLALGCCIIGPFLLILAVDAVFGLSLRHELVQMALSR